MELCRRDGLDFVLNNITQRIRFRERQTGTTVPCYSALRLQLAKKHWELVRKKMAHPCMRKTFVVYGVAQKWHIFVRLITSSNIDQF